MSADRLAALGAATYVSLATFRRDGREVRTPVWVARHGERLYVFSAGDAGKVKRIRATRRVRLAPCGARGQLAADAAWSDALGRVVSPDETPLVQGAYRAFRAKYGLIMWLTDGLSRLTGRHGRRAMLEIELGTGAGSA